MAPRLRLKAKVWCFWGGVCRGVYVSNVLYRAERVCFVPIIVLCVLYVPRMPYITYIP